MTITEGAIKNRLISGIVIALSLAAGLVAYQTMPRFEDPEFLIRNAQIITSYPGATPLEVIDEVSEPIVSELQGMQEVKEITSTAFFGRSIIEVEIKHAFAPDKRALEGIWGRMRDRVNSARANLPPGVGEPFIFDDFGDVYGLYYIITGEDYTIRELEDYADALRKDLLLVPGVAKVDIQGAQQEVIYVEIARDRAASLGVSLADVIGDLSEQNSVVSAGDVELATIRANIIPSGTLNTVEAIRNLVVSTGSAGELLYLGDIATVTRGVVEPTRYRARYNGQPAITLAVSNVMGANVSKIGAVVERRLAETINTRPLGIEVHEFYHQGKIVTASVEDFVVNVALALLIVLVTLFVFMGLRSAVVIGAALLVTIAATLGIMYVTEIPLHRISLGALIIALGMLVDNAIVIAEGILVGVNRGQTVVRAAVDIVKQTKWALFGGTVVGILAFAPIGLAPGNVAEYTNHLFWVILISLSLSWIFALTLVPMIAALLFKPKAVAEDTPPPKPNVFTRTYRSGLTIAVRFKSVTLLAAAGVFAASIYGFTHVTMGFFPTSTTPQVAIDFWLPEGTDLETTAAKMVSIEDELAGFEGVSDIHTLIGGGTSRYMLIYTPENRNSAFGQFLLKIDDFERIEPLIDELQGFIDAQFPDVQARVWRFRLGPSQGSKIEAVFKGPDPAVLRNLERQAVAILQTDPQTVAVKSDWRQQVPVVEPVYSEARGRRVGASREAVAQSLRVNFNGEIVGTFREGDALIPIMIRAPDRERLDLETAASIQVLSDTTGMTVPLSEVIDDVTVRWRDGQMKRVNRVWTIKAQADPARGVEASVVQARLAPQIEAIPLPPGYSLEWGGELGDSAEANSQLATTLPLGVLAMVLAVVFLFNAIRQSLVIWLLVPLSIIGVVVGMLITNTILEFMAILGILSLSGLFIKNAIVLVDQMDLEIREGKPRFDAVIDSTLSRVRPVCMGALTTILGVIPLMTDVFFGSMAVVIAFGLAFATALTLVVLPALYAAMFGIGPSERATA